MIAVEKNSELKLLEMAKNISHDRNAFCAVHFLFSKLESRYKSKYQIKIAVNIIKDVFSDNDGCVFLLSDLDVFLIFHLNDKELFDKSVYQLRYLFIEDPLTHGDQHGGTFFIFYDLSLQFETFLAVCTQKLHAYQGIYNNSNKNLYAKSLLIFENEIKEIDILSISSFQPICTIQHQSGQVIPIYDSLSVDLNKLFKMIGINVNKEPSSILSKYVTSCLDKMILKMISSKPSYYFTRPISITLGAETIISKDFQDFHNEIQNNKQGKLSVIEIDIADLFINIDTFLKAKKIINKLGYSLCVSNINHIGFINFNRINFDTQLIKLTWNSDFKHYIAQLKEGILSSHPNRTILSQCNNIESIEIGLSLGAALFQGEQLEKMINKKAVLQ